VGDRSFGARRFDEGVKKAKFPLSIRRRGDRRSRGGVRSYGFTVKTALLLMPLAAAWMVTWVVVVTTRVVIG